MYQAWSIQCAMSEAMYSLVLSVMKLTTKLMVPWGVFWKQTKVVYTFTVFNQGGI